MKGGSFFLFKKKKDATTLFDASTVRDNAFLLSMCSDAIILIAEKKEKIVFNCIHFFVCCPTGCCGFGFL